MIKVHIALPLLVSHVPIEDRGQFLSRYQNCRHHHHHHHRRNGAVVARWQAAIAQTLLQARSGLVYTVALYEPHGISSPAAWMMVFVTLANSPLASTLPAVHLPATS